MERILESSRSGMRILRAGSLGQSRHGDTECSQTPRTPAIEKADLEYRSLIRNAAAQQIRWAVVYAHVKPEVGIRSELFRGSAPFHSDFGKMR
jgi:hypothetical protein